MLDEEGILPVEDILYGFLKMRQPRIGPRVNMDTVLLAGFAKPRAGERVIELGCAHGAVTLALAKRFPDADFLGLDIQGGLIGLAKGNAELNGIANAEFTRCDLREVRKSFAHQSFDALVVNPPYEDSGFGRRSGHETNRISRQGEDCTLADVCAAARFLLRNKGRLYMVMRALRLAETLALLREANVEPRTLRMVHPTPAKNASVFLLEAVRGGGAALTALPPLYIYGSDGEYTDELMEFYAAEPPSGRPRTSEV